LELSLPKLFIYSPAALTEAQKLWLANIKLPGGMPVPFQIITPADGMDGDGGGFVAVGVPIGTPGFCKAYVRERCDRTAAALRTICKALDTPTIVTADGAVHMAQYIIKVGACAQQIHTARTVQGCDLGHLTEELRRSIITLYKLRADAGKALQLEGTELERAWARCHHPSSMGGLGMTSVADIASAAYLGMLRLCAPKLTDIIPGFVRLHGLGRHVKAKLQAAADDIEQRVAQHEHSAEKVASVLQRDFTPESLVTGSVSAQYQHKLSAYIHAANHHSILEALPMASPALAHQRALEVDMIRAQFLEAVEDKDKRNSSSGILDAHPFQCGASNSAVIWAGQFYSGFGHSDDHKQYYCKSCSQPIHPLVFVHYAICPCRKRALKEGVACDQSRHKSLKVAVRNLVYSLGGTTKSREPRIADYFTHFKINPDYKGKKATLGAQADLAISFKVLEMSEGNVPQVTTKVLLVDLMCVDAYITKDSRPGPTQQHKHANYVPGASAEAGEQSKLRDYKDKYMGIDYSKMVCVAMDSSVHFSSGLMKVLRWIATQGSLTHRRIAAYNNSYAYNITKIKRLLAVYVQIWNAQFFYTHTTNGPIVTLPATPKSASQDTPSSQGTQGSSPRRKRTRSTADSQDSQPGTQSDTQPQGTQGRRKRTADSQDSQPGTQSDTQPQLHLYSTLGETFGPPDAVSAYKGDPLTPSTVQLRLHWTVQDEFTWVPYSLCSNEPAVQAYLTDTPELTILTFGSDDSDRYNSIVAILETEIPDEYKKRGNCCWIDIQTYYYGNIEVFESFAGPLQVEDMYGQRHMYKAYVVEQPRLRRRPKVHLDNGPNQPRYDGDVHEILLHVPALDNLYPDKHIARLNLWSIRQLCHNWNQQLPRGAIEVTAPKARNMLEHEKHAGTRVLSAPWRAPLSD